MEKHPTLKQGTRVLIPVDGRYVSGTICGLSGIEMPIIGQGYIVDLGDVLSDYYPYSHTIVFGAYIKLLA